MSHESERPVESIYPEPQRGSLTEDHDSYGKPFEPKGPKMGSSQRNIMLFGVVFFVIFLIGFALFAGFASYY